jgi:hypothetical protein
LEIVHTSAVALGDDTWRVEAGLANTGWLPTYVTDKARRSNLVRPIVATIDGGEVLGGTPRIQLGQLAGRINARFAGGRDGTPDRVLATWVVRAVPGTTLTVTAEHQRAGSATATIALGA